MSTPTPAGNGDPGLFGPHSVTWRLHRDPSSMVGGVRALLVQALEPRAMAAVVEAGGFAADQSGRLARTSAYMAAITFGDTETAERAAARVRRVHSRIAGVDPVTGRPYRADDPELLLWVHAAFVDSMLVAYRRFGGPLSRSDADRYVAEQVRAAELVGLDPAGVPATERALRAYLRSVQGSLQGTPAAREGARRLAALSVPLHVRPLWAVVFGAAVSTLPRWAKHAYRLPWFPPADAAVQPAVFGLLRVLNVVLPDPPAARAADARVA